MADKHQALMTRAAGSPVGAAANNGYTRLVTQVSAGRAFQRARALWLLLVVALVALSAVFDLPSSPVIVWAMALVGLAVHFGGRSA
jgi:hypothetical protein